MHDLLNLSGAPAIQWARLMLFQSALLVALLLAVDWLLGRRLRSAVRYALWLLVLLKLLLPPSLLLPTGAGFWLGRWWADPVQIPPPSRMTIATRDVLPIPVPEPGPMLSPAPPVPASLARDAWLLLLWLAGATLLAAGLWIRNRPLRRIARDAVEAPETVLEHLRTAVEILGQSQIPRLRVTAADHSPAVHGLFRPEILLPARLADRLAPEALQLVLLHETAHLNRRDLWVTWMQAVVQVVWWWNPAVWIANARIRALREEAVDDLVMAVTRHDPSAYPSALLAVARHCAGRPMLALSLLGIFEAGGSLRPRVTRLLQRSPPRRPNLGISGWMLCLAAGFVLLPMAFERRMEAAAADDAAISAQVAPNRDPAITNGITPGVLQGLPTPGPLFTRTFRVNPRIFLQGLEAVVGFPFGNITGGNPTGSGGAWGGVGIAGGVGISNTTHTNGTASVSILLRKFFTACGVDFSQRGLVPGGSQDPHAGQKALFFNDRTGILFVRATEADLEVIEKAIQALNVAPPQVEVEARFVVVEEGQAESLGLDFLLKAPPGSDASGTNAAVGILTPSQYQSARAALESRTGVQVLAAPRVVTLSGRQAVVTVAGVIPVPDTQGRLQDIPFGPALEVIPEVMSDDVAIQLAVTASFSELLAMDSSAQFPLRVRSGKFSASAALRDAQTLVLAGELVEGDGALKDTAAAISGGPPVLEWDRGPEWTPAGRRLLVFITPVIVDPAGNRVNDPPK